jgi:hypothetical protein
LVLEFGIKDPEVTNNNMRAFIYIDVVVQTFILCAWVLLVSVTVAENSFETFGLMAMYGAFFLGPWQMLSSMITCSLRGMFLKWRLIHLGSAIVYLVVTFSFFRSAEMLNGVVEGVGKIIGFAVPATLAIFYYNITVKSFRVVRSQSIKQ